MGLPLVGRAGDDEVVEQRGDFRDVEDHDVLTFKLLADTGAQAGTFQTRHAFDRIRLLRRFGIDFGDL
jgi:hypothetical protein